MKSLITAFSFIPPSKTCMLYIKIKNGLEWFDNGLLVDEGGIAKPGQIQRAESPAQITIGDRINDIV